jgi:pyruvate formate lyase activating enzyme
MIFGGIQHTSLIDYPGKISAVLFTAGCNLACPYCHNPDLVNGLLAQPLSETKVIEYLHQRRNWLEAVVVSGGEPTLQERLTDFCETVKQMGYAVKLDTNGSRPAIIKTLLARQLLDYVAMDVKGDPHGCDSRLGGHLDPDVLPESIRVIQQHALAYEFRTTCARPFIDAATIDRIARAIQGASRYVLQTFRPVRVLDRQWLLNQPLQFEPSDLLQLKAVAEPWVKHCQVR